MTVLVERRAAHELYGKIVARSRKYHAHDEKGEYNMGDMVEIAETAPAVEDQELGRDPSGREGSPSLTSTLSLDQQGPCTPRASDGRTLEYWRPAVFISPS